MPASRDICLYLAALIASVVLRVSAEEEILVGRTSAGQLEVQVHFAQPLALLPSVYPGISGYATGDLGFHSTILDDPASDFFQLSTAADFRLILLAKDPGMEVWNDHGSGYLGIGESFYVGSAPFDTHPIWNLVSGAPGATYSLTLKLLDLSGLYPDSAPIVLSFTPSITSFKLSLQQAVPGQIALSWPTNAAGWTLESAPALTPAAWVAVTNAPTSAGANFSLNLGISGAQRFFRLRKP